MKRILFISHDVSRTGAPNVLFLFLKWIRENHKGITIHFTSLRGGEMEPDFLSIAHVYTKKPEKSLKDRIKQKFFQKHLHSTLPDAYLKELTQYSYDIIYSNTVVSLPLANNIKAIQPKAKLLLHLHEMPTIIKILCPDFKTYIKNVEKLISPSYLVAETVHKEFGVSTESMEIIYEFTRSLSPHKKNEITDVFKIAACGTFHWRKGGDIFLQIARYIKYKFPEMKIHFTWIGKVPESERFILNADLRKMGISDMVSFTGEVNRPEEILCEQDVFLLPSREDPFPLAAIEAGMLGLPIICFMEATGIQEIILEKGGFAVPYLDIEKAAEKIIFYFENPDHREEDSKINAKQFSDFIAEKKCPDLFRLIFD